jgi:hypothetical protein
MSALRISQVPVYPHQPTLGEWRNWQTRRIQVPVSARTWGFKSPFAHPPTRAPTLKGTVDAMASYTVNKKAVAKARSLIDSKQYVLDSDWGESQPSADDANAYLEKHSWDEYAEWHLGLTDGATDETKARYAFVYGDLRRLHRSGLIACIYRASEWRHKSIELAAHDLLQQLDSVTA